MDHTEPEQLSENVESTSTSDSAEPVRAEPSLAEPAHDEPEAAESLPIEAAPADSVTTHSVTTEAETEPSETGTAQPKRKRKRKRASEAVVDQTSSAPFWPLIRAAKTRHVFSRGEIVAGKVLHLTEGAVVVDLFGKAQAIADAHDPRSPVPPTSQASENPTETTEEAAPVTAAPVAEEPLNEGDIFRGCVAAISESGHIGLYNRVLDEEGVKQRLQHARETHTPIEGVVYGFNRGGFDVLIDGVRAFCPARGMSLQVITNPHMYLGHKYPFMVSASKERQDAVIVTRRPMLESEALERAKEVIGHLTVGEVIKGKVTEVREFGLFVDIGGVQGLVHATELSFDRTKRPQDVAQVGDELDVKVLEVLEPQRKKEKHERVSLSLKALQSDPWQEHREWLHEGAVRQGKVTKLAEFGAFIELAPAIEGLLHISELGASGAQPLQVNDELEVVLERVDANTRRISLSRLTPDDAKAIAEAKEQGLEPVRPRSLKPGSRIEVRVVRTSRQGAEVHVVGMIGKRGRGFVPIREMGAKEGTGREKLWESGNQVMVKVVRIDRDGTLQCSHKAYLSDEEKRAVKDYRKEASKQTLGTLGDLLRQKLGQ